MASRSVLVFGATGTIGRPIVTELINNKSSFDRLVVFTSPGGSAQKKALLDSWKAAGVEILEGDVTNKEQILKAYEGIDTIVSALGRGAIANQILLIELAEQTPNIARFIPSEFGTDIEHGPASAHEKPHQQKLKVRAALAASTTLDYTYVVTGPFAYAGAGMYLAAVPQVPEIGTYDVKAKKATLVGTGDEEIALTTLPDVAKQLLKVLQQPEKSSKRALKLKSFVTTPHKIVREFERQTGSKWEVLYTSIARLKELEEKAWAAQNPFAAGFTLRRIWATGGTLYDSWDNEVIGATETDTLEDAVRMAIAEQESQG